MESKKEPMGMCEKLFNVFNVNNSAFRPLRRLTIKNHQEPPPTTTPHPNKPIPSQVLENNNNNNNINPSHHHHHHHDTPTSSLIPHEPQQQTTTPPPKKLPLDAIQVQAPSSKIEIQNQLQAQQKVPVNHRSTTTTTNKEEAAPKIVVQAPQAQLPVPTPPAMAPPPATVAGRRQPQRLETKNIDGKADDFINRVRDKLKNGSNVGRGATSKSN